VIRGAGAQRQEPTPADASRSRISSLTERLRGAADRAFSPLGYLALFGGMQLGLVLLLSRFWPVWLTALGTLALLALLAVLARVRNRWTAKMLGLLLVIGLLVVGPGLVLMHDRTVRGITSMEHDGAIQAEVAMDRLLHGQPIYGVDWSQTAVGRVPWNYSLGPANPALHHNVYFPLVPLAGVPLAWVARAFGFAYDYRQVLLVFLALGLLAVWMLPIAAARRFAIAATLFLSPLLGLYYWAGRNDVPVVALVILGLGLLATNRPAVASLVIGAAVAYKLFAAPAVPFLLATLWLRWRQGRDGGELARSLLALALVPAITILPFAVAAPAAFLRDVVSYPGAGGPDSYPISGFGLGGALLAIHALHRTDPVPFWIFQLAALALALRVTLPWFMRHPSAGRWMTGFTASLFAMTFFARYFNDSHAALVMAVLACCVPLGDSTLLAVPKTPSPTLPLRGREPELRRREPKIIGSSWLDAGTWR
jgi:hypothetical protein